jgi:acyl carrier protein
MRDEIRRYLLTHRASKEVTALSDQDSLLETGVIDSLAMVDLIAHLEKTYGISIGEDDMVPENFDSIDSIASYVERRRGKPASGN